MTTLLSAAYVLVLVVIGGGSVISSMRKHAWPATTLELVTSVGWPVLVAAFFWPTFGRTARVAIPPLFVIAACWTLYTLWRDFRPSVMRTQVPPELGPFWRRATLAASTALCALMVVPVYILGALAVARSLAAA
jgi:hypothetical protein